MEKILDVYCQNYDAQHPLICMDEAAKQIVSDCEPALPMSPGRPRAKIIITCGKACGPSSCSSIHCVGGDGSAREGRTRWDWAEEVRQLLEEDYPQARQVTLVCDNLNTHDIASFYTAFDAPTAHRLARRVKLEHTPRNGSWLNMAEMELSVLTRQCIGRRFDTPSKWTRPSPPGNANAIKPAPAPLGDSPPPTPESNYSDSIRQLTFKSRRTSRSGPACADIIRTGYWPAAASADRSLACSIDPTASRCAACRPPAVVVCCSSLEIPP